MSIRWEEELEVSNYQVRLFLREVAESLLGEKLGAGEGLLPTARIAWMPRDLYAPEVDHLPWPPKLLGPPLPMPLPSISSPTSLTFGNKAAMQVFGWRRFQVDVQS